MEKELAKYREKDLETQGKTDELISNYRKKTEELETALKKTKQTYAWNTVSSVIKMEATKLGCQDPDKLLRLMDNEDLQALEVDENFNIDREALGKILEKNKKENYFLFKESAPKMASGLPKTSSGEKKKDLSELTKEELLAHAKSIGLRTLK
jgi:hypothetical protein